MTGSRVADCIVCYTYGTAKASILGSGIREHREPSSDRRRTLHNDLSAIYVEYRHPKALLMHFRRDLHRKFRISDRVWHTGASRRRRVFARALFRWKLWSSSPLAVAVGLLRTRKSSTVRVAPLLAARVSLAATAAAHNV